MSSRGIGGLELQPTDLSLGIFNNRHLHETLPLEAARARQAGQSLALIIACLDELQQIIDTHGQQTGDAVIQHTVNLTRSALRHADWMARHEGTELAIVLPGTHLDGAYAAAERMRRRCTETPFALGTSQLIVTASFGVASMDASFVLPDDATALLHGARGALHESKRIGRNRVACAPARSIRASNAVPVGGGSQRGDLFP